MYTQPDYSEFFKNQLSCETTREANVRAVVGSLALTAIYQDTSTSEYSKPFTAGYVYASQLFGYARFVTRASMAKGGLLRSEIILHENGWGGPNWLKIYLVKYQQEANSFDVGITQYHGQEYSVTFSVMFTYEHSKGGSILIARKLSALNLFARKQSEHNTKRNYKKLFTVIFLYSRYFGR